MTIRQLLVQRPLLHDTLAELRSEGALKTERVALWLGRRNVTQVLVEELYVPDYEARSDFFHIGPQAMRDLMSHLRVTGRMIAAQLHTHPEEAFHSLADDRWAIVRHVGALSIVLPEFGLRSTPENFLTTAKVFYLDSDNAWIEAAHDVVPQFLETL